MALSFVQKPQDVNNDIPFITNWTPLLGFMLHQDASIAAFYYYKMVLEIRKDDASGELLAKLKQRRNVYSQDVEDHEARALFDIRGIVNSVLVNTVFDQNCTGTPFQSIHTLGSNTGHTDKVFSHNGDRNTDETQVQTIYVKGYQQYAESANAIPEEVTTGSQNYTARYMQGSLPLMTPRGTANFILDPTPLEVFQGSSDTDRFLSDVATSTDSQYNITGYINYVQETDYHTIAFLNDEGNFDSEIHKIRTVFYNSAGALLNLDTVDNDTDEGGLPPDDGGLEDETRLLYFGCGPANLEAQTIGTFSNAKPSNNSGWAYYTVQGRNSANSANKTAKYYFIKQDGNCKGHKVRRLAWRNSMGCYDYFNFKMKSTQNLKIERNNYNTMLGTFNKSRWRYDDTQRGKTTRQTKATLTETLNTDWLNEQQAELIEKLIYSTDVYIVENADTDYTEGVVLTDSNFIRKTIANDKLIQYTITIEYANPINTNS